MFGSNAIEIGIGLVFVYLALSLVCTAVNELVAGLFRSRARDLERGIRNLLDGSSRFPLRWWQAIQNVPAPHTSNWADRFFGHQLVNGTSKDGEKPSYVPSQTFSAVLNHLIAAAGGQCAATGRCTGRESPWFRQL